MQNEQVTSCLSVQFCMRGSGNLGQAKGLMHLGRTPAEAHAGMVPLWVAGSSNASKCLLKQLQLSTTHSGTG